MSGVDYDSKTLIKYINNFEIVQNFTKKQFFYEQRLISTCL